MVNTALAVEEVEYSITVPDYIDIETNLTISNILSYTDVTYAYDAAPWGLDWGEIHAPYKWKVTTANGELTISFERYETVSTEPLIITFFRTVTEQTGSHSETRYREVRQSQTTGIMGIPMSAGIQATGWWNGAWQYRIDNPLPDGARPYQLSLTVSNSIGANNATHVFLNDNAKDDLSDIRFTLNNATELPYWIENITEGKVWVKVPDNGTVNIYYGNPSAVDSSDGTSTFEFFDDFTSLDLGANPVMLPDKSSWESESGGKLRWGTIAYSDGMYYIYYTNGSSSASAIGRATSTDLITWTKNINNPVILNRIGPSLLKELDGKTPVVFEEKYWMLTMKSDGSAIELRSASTLDNDTWNLENSSLIPKVPGTWFANWSFTTSFVKEGDDNYYIFMESGIPGKKWKIGYFNALSPKGPFSNRSVLLSPEFPWEGNGTLDPEIRKFGDTYYLFYTANDNLPYQNSYAKSSSLGGSYTKSNINLTPVNQSYPAILQKDAYYYILTDDQPGNRPGKSLYRRKYLNGSFGSPFIWNRGGSPTVSGSELLINASGEFIRSNSNFLYKAMKIRAKYAPLKDDIDNTYQYMGFAADSQARDLNSEMISSYDTAPNLKAWSGNATKDENSSINDTDYFGSYHNYEILWRNGEAKFIIDDVLKATQTKYVANTPQPVGIYDYATNASFYVDWVFVRNYVWLEPAWGVWSAERTSQSGNAPVITGSAPASPVSDTERAPRKFNITTDQTVNVTWYINGTPVQSTEKDITSAIYTNTSAAKGTWIVNATASNVNGSASIEWIWTVNTQSASGSPSITGFAPASPINDIEGTTRSFNITVNQTMNVTWYINGTPVKSTEKGVTSAIYTNTSAEPGTWNVTAIASNTNGNKMQIWEWIVTKPLVINIISPVNDSVNLTGYVNVTVKLNKTGTAQYLNWNGVNYTMTPNTSQPSGTVFFRNMTGLLSGKYSLKVYANDTTGVSNVSETRVVTVNRTIVTTIGSFINTTNFIVNKTIEITAPSGNVTVTIPNGTNASVGGAALTSISIDSLAQVNSTFVANLGSSDKLIGENLSLGPEGAQFSPDIQIRFNYTDPQLTAAGITESSLRVKFYNTTANIWVEQTPYTLNTTGKYIIANVSHFSTFGLVGTITQTAANPPSSSSGGGSSGGGGGGGGGGASGENYGNIQLKEKYEESIFKDKPTSYRFKNASNPVMFVNITGNVNAGLIETMAEVLKGTSTLVKEAPPGIVYKNVNLWVGTSGFATSKNIKEATIIFRVENSWIDGNAFPGNEVKLAKWDNGKWITLETSEKMKDTTYTYFEGKTTSFSSFAITGIKVASSAPAFEVTPTQSTPAAPATTNTTTTTEKAPATNLFMIIGALAIIAIIVALYLKYK